MDSLFFTIIVLTIYSPTHSEWISHPQNTMPRDDTLCAIGSYNGSIYLLGGFNKPRQQTIYDTKTDSFVLYNSNFISTDAKVFGEAQYWTQIQSNLYILNDLDTDNNKISVFNMATNSFNPNFEPVPIAMSDGMGRACIASSSFYNSIFINGGITTEGIPRGETYVLNIQTMEWGTVSTLMQKARRSHTCIIHPTNHVLYSISGESEDGITTTIEKISITDVNDTEWTYLNDSLSDYFFFSVKGLRSIISGDYVVIIGGFKDTIHLIDTNTDLVTVSDMKLAFTTAYSAAITVDNIMYSFGGSLGVDEWQSCESCVTSVSPTTSPVSYIPTISTASPTMSTIFNGTTVTIEEEAKTGFTTGNVVGISFAVALVVCLLVVILCFCCRDKNKMRRKHKENIGHVDDDNFRKSLQHSKKNDFVFPDDKKENEISDTEESMNGVNTNNTNNEDENGATNATDQPSLRGDFNSSMALMNNDC